MSAQYLRRYTDLAALIYLLTERKITLLDPRSWDDSNDSHYLRTYRNKKRLKSVLALCFTQASERYHHWRVFTSGSSGVRIRFRRSELLSAIRRMQNVQARRVEYLTLPELRRKAPDTQDLPFLKRYPFTDEREFRIIWESETMKMHALDILIPLSCIDEIILSPWLPHALSGNIRRLLRRIPGCGKLKIARSTLISNEEWKNLAEG
jgi:hypothetical protein